MGSEPFLGDAVRVMTGRAKLLRVAAAAELAADDRSGLESIRAHADEDADLALLMEDYARGQVLMVDLHVEVDVQGPDGAVHRASCRNAGMIVEPGDVPVVEKQVSELSAKDYDDLAEQLGRRGLVVDPDDLEDAFTHVSLGERLRAALDR